ncbi:DUF6777 domain-containing protein [Streptomyces sp. NPDC002588]|uniref:DUF6777 domain-containing protein n=1 Tax=Streptomyces sp. NPDC002588 TaxID=3154419 RepID=UPI0033328929
MSVDPPSSGRPTGPPSGPLSGPSQPPSGPPSEPPPGDSSGGSSGGGTVPGGTPGREPEPGRPWWRSAPRLALLITAVVVAVALALLLTLPGGGGSGGTAAAEGKIFTQAAAKTGPDPFTESTATDSSLAPAAPTPTGGTTESAGTTLRRVDGGAAGVYGGTRNVASCDVEKQIGALQAAPAKNRAFASVAGVEPARVPAYLRSLTPVQLRMDTWVTNHGYRDGAVTTYQAVLQAGTAVLVDRHGMPRVRCACGNPLTKPVPQRTAPERTGDTWPSYNPANVVVVAPAAKVVKEFVLYDPSHRHHWFARQPGDTGGHKDRPAKPPKKPRPDVTVTSPSPPTGSSSSTGPSSPSSPSSPSTPDSPSTSTPSDSGQTSQPETATPSSSGTPESSAGESSVEESSGSVAPPQPGTPGSALLSSAGNPSSAPGAPVGSRIL